MARAADVSTRTSGFIGARRGLRLMWRRAWGRLVGMRSAGKVMASNTRLLWWRPRTWLAVMALVGMVGLVAWESFAAGGVFNNTSADGPQRADALMVVLTVVTLLVALYSVSMDRRSCLHTVPAATPADADEAPVLTPVRLRDGLPRLGDDPALAVDRLRVHRCIPLPARATASLHPDLPRWVERARASELRAWMIKARRHGGFVVIVGESSVGKTRLLYEAAVAELAGCSTDSSPGPGLAPMAPLCRLMTLRACWPPRYR